MSAIKNRYPLSFASIIASVYPIGFIPKAPGTWGSIPGLLVGQLIAVGAHSIYGDQPLMAFLISLLALGALVAFSWWSIAVTEREWNTHDNPRIVIDEVAGQAIACGFFVFDFWYLLISFVVFRILDIRKPSLIGLLDRELPGAAGTLLDDVLAGVLVALGWWLYFLFIPLG